MHRASPSLTGVWRGVLRVKPNHPDVDEACPPEGQGHPFREDGFLHMILRSSALGNPATACDVDNQAPIVFQWSMAFAGLAEPSSVFNESTRAM